MNTFCTWQPYIDQLGAFEPPSDPPHCTYNFLREPDDSYEQAWLAKKENDTEHLKITDVGPAGVAAHVELSPSQMSWYALHPDAEPHITLAVAQGKLPKGLGPMVKTAISLHYLPTDNPLIHPSADDTITYISACSQNLAILEMTNRERLFEDDQSDHLLADALLASIPEKLWTTGPHDVGLVPGTVTLTLADQTQTPIWKPQYPLDAKRADGIRETIADLLDAGFLREVPQSRWNTPILPVPKAGGKGWRIVRDLRPINKITTTLNLPVPDPYC